jgi:hypothetical protein
MDKLIGMAKLVLKKVMIVILISNGKLKNKSILLTLSIPSILSKHKDNIVTLVKIGHH